MTQTKVKILPSAQKDTDHAIDYYYARNPQSAFALEDSVRNATIQLLEFPESGSPAKQLKRKGFRFLVLEYQYNLFYMVAGDTVYIYRVLAGKQNSKAIFKKPK